MKRKRLEWVWFKDFKCYYAYNKKDKTELGLLEWNNNWKGWTWEQHTDIEMSWDCLQEVVDYAKELTEKGASKIKSKN